MNARQTKFEAALDQLAERLRAKPCTARQLAQALECSKPTVYARLEALEVRGVRIDRKLARDGTRGPLAVEFRIPEKRKRRRTA